MNLVLKLTPLVPFFVLIAAMAAAAGLYARRHLPCSTCVAPEPNAAAHPPSFLPCAQPMGPHLRRLYYLAIGALLAAVLLANVWPGGSGGGSTPASCLATDNRAR